VLVTGAVAPPSPPAIETIGLNVTYGRHEAVRDVSIVVAAGEAVALVGRNGAGKSSLLRAVSGLENATGRVVVHGQHCHHRTTLAPVAYVPQRSTARWDLPLTVSEVVVAGCRARGGRWRRPSPDDRGQVRMSLRTFGIEDLHDRTVGALSGGQAQRVLLARAFVQRPRVLLLDEPFAGLDSASADSLSQAIGELCANGMTVLCAMHELAIARSVFPRTIALDRAVIADGPTGEVLAAEGIERIFVTRPASSPAGTVG
jgi:ABC-type Mn2+/Zn2+ transport system ATPase subunit